MPAVGGGAIQETGVAAVDGKVYVVGGFTDSLALSEAVHVYDTTAGSWSQAAPLPLAIHHANVAATSDALYVLGGMQLNGFSFASIGDSFVYSPQNDSWTSLPSIPQGFERGSAAVGVLGNRIVLAGGLGDDPVASVIAFNLDTETWETDLPSLPTPTDHHVGAVVGDVLYAIGGRTGGISTIKDTVVSLSLGADAWQERAALPTARGGAAVGVVGGRILVVGGEGNPDEVSGVFSEAELYDPSTDSWTPLPDMEVPRHGMGAAGIGDTLYVPGGATTEGFGAVATSEMYRL